MSIAGPMHTYKESVKISHLRDDSAWQDVFAQFNDATIFQTSPFASSATGVSHGGIEHVVLSRGQTLAAATLLRLIRVPGVGVELGYVFSGPLFEKNSQELDWSILAASLQALRAEYVDERGVSLRIVPPFTLQNSKQWTTCLLDTGYQRAKLPVFKNTILLDIQPALSDIRKSMDKKWRNCLNASERQNLELVTGSDEVSFDLFETVYREMLNRKRLVEPGNLRRFRHIQRQLPSELQMTAIVAKDELGPCAGLICSAIGRRGIFLFGATGDRGVANKASYLIQWRALEWLKQRGCTEYDLHGSNRTTNPGVYAFKMGLCGSNGREVEAVGRFDARCGGLGRFAWDLADLGISARTQFKKRFGKIGLD